ncbi:MAG: branched-chain amino acid aminotransferase [Muribaculaceae bacterium]|nr:branched-chain amino acid aminotransferase [Muribaculaceae bacterium]MDE6331427.1 branched-chain amino acid aminotransferase [Muribaculaceae bacterium]
MTKQTEIDWSNLPFGYYPADYNLRCYYRNGKWGEIEVSSEETVNLHIAATTLHYGQEIFEGLKAFRGADGKIRIFRLEENARRMRESAEGLLMAPVPEDLFREMCVRAVKLNEHLLPPYESGASLYIRPLEIGLTPRIGVKAADDYLFMVLVTPVGPYFKTGFGCTNICITRQYDRVAPRGTGRFKCGGNYAAALKASEMAHDNGYSAVLFLDPMEKKYLDECGPANFFAVKDGKYITPASESILQSITNMSLQTLARDMGIEVECRHITVDELEQCTEAAAIGTAAVASPVGEIDDLDTGKKYVISKDGKPGPVTTALYRKLNDIRYGIEPDVYGWNTMVE